MATKMSLNQSAPAERLPRFVKDLGEKLQVLKTVQEQEPGLETDTHPHTLFSLASTKRPPLPARSEQPLVGKKGL